MKLQNNFIDDQPNAHLVQEKLMEIVMSPHLPQFIDHKLFEVIMSHVTLDFPHSLV
jgi:hypothetical protein